MRCKILRKLLLSLNILQSLKFAVVTLAQVNIAADFTIVI